MSSSHSARRLARLTLALSILFNCFVPAVYPVGLSVALCSENDDFADAQSIEGNTGSVAADNSCATKETGEPDHAGHATGISVWYYWQATESGRVTFDTAGSEVDTVMAVYTGNSVSALTEVASNDDTASDVHSRISFDATEDAVYYIALDVYDEVGYSAPMTLNWHLGNPAPTPTPDESNRLAFGSERGVTTGVYVMNGDGGAQTRLTDKSSNSSGPVWSGDGTKLAFTTYRDGQREIYAMEADGSNETRLTTSWIGSYEPAWSPAGSVIAFYSFDAQGKSDIYVINADGTGLSNLTGNQTGSHYSPSWSPDGTKIAYVSYDDNASGVYVMDADGTDKTRLTTQLDDSAVWSPDGTKIAFVRWGDNAEIYVMDADGSDQTNLTNTSGVLPAPPGNYLPAWSPDGTKIAFSTDRDGQAEIYIMDADGSDQTRLTNSAGSDGPRWSPDGSKIAFLTSRDGNQEIYVMNADGSNQVRLTSTPGYEETFSWMPASD